MTDRLLDPIARELCEAEARTPLRSVARTVQRYPIGWPSRLVSLLSKPRAELTQDERKWLAPEIIAVCGVSFAEAGRIANRDRRTMHDYVNPELRGKTMPDEVMDELVDYAVWQAGNARFSRSA